MSAKEIEFSVESIVGRMTKKPLVRIRLAEADVMLHAENAREMARVLLLAAESATHDLALATYLTDEMGFHIDQAAQVIQGVRDHRSDTQEATWEGHAGGDVDA